MIKKIFFITIVVVLTFSCNKSAVEEQQVIEQQEEESYTPRPVDSEEREIIRSVIKDPFGIGFESELEISQLIEKVGPATNTEYVGESDFGEITNHIFEDLLVTDIGNTVRMIEIQSSIYVLNLNIKVGDSISYIAETMADPQWRDSNNMWSYMYDQYALTFFFNSDGIVEKIIWNWDVT